MKSGLPFELLVSVSEKVLKDNGYVYARNASGDIAEFEVRRPEGFIIRFQKLPEVEFGSSLLGPLWTRRLGESTRVTVVLGSEVKASRVAAAAFVRILIDSLPSRPWGGMGLVERMTAKAQWNRWAEGKETG